MLGVTPTETTYGLLGTGIQVLFFFNVVLRPQKPYEKLGRGAQHLNFHTSHELWVQE